MTVFDQCDEPGCTMFAGSASKCPDHVPMTIDQRDTLKVLGDAQVSFLRTLTICDCEAIKKALQLIDKLDAENEQLCSIHASYVNKNINLAAELEMTKQSIRIALRHLQTNGD
jgi:hypothetical protein